VILIVAIVLELKSLIILYVKIFNTICLGFWGQGLGFPATT